MTETSTTQDAQSDQSVQEKPAEDGTGPVVTTSQLLQAGVHFGHQTRRWNPKMKRFLHGDIGGIYIIDLKQTLARIEEAYVFVRNMVAAGGTLLFVGTKKQIQESTARHAKRCGMPYVNERWLGGMLTNIETIFKRVRKMQEYQRMQSSGEFDAMPKKESLSLKRELAKLERNLGGIGQMDTPPEAVFVLDTKTEHIAVTEANKLRIPLIAVVDTNCDPDLVGYVIPGNDDSIRAGDLMCQIMADAVIAGKKYGKITDTAEVLQAAKVQPTTTDGERLEEVPRAETLARSEVVLKRTEEQPSELVSATASRTSSTSEQGSAVSRADSPEVPSAAEPIAVTEVVADAQVEPQAEPGSAPPQQEEAAPPSAAAEVREPVDSPESAREISDAVLTHPQEVASAPAEETQETSEETLGEPGQAAAEPPEAPEVPAAAAEPPEVETRDVDVAEAAAQAMVAVEPSEVETRDVDVAEAAAETTTPEHVEQAPDATQTADPTAAAATEETPQGTGGTTRRGMFLRSRREKKSQRKESRETGRRRSGSRSD